MAQLAKSLRLYLAYALSCYLEFIPDLLEGSRSAVVKTETQSYYLFLPRRKGGQNGIELLLQQCLRCRLLRSES